MHTITALLGSSGCGKTTLLNELFQKYKNQVTYVSQDPPMLDFLSVKETILMNISFKKLYDVQILTQDAIKIMGLTLCQDTLLKNVSGGEKKRTSIASELYSLFSCNLLILDEPCSSLDSYSANSLLTLLKMMELNVLMSIHQPSGIIFDSFDKVIFMGTNGKILYYGMPSTCVEYFQKLYGPKDALMNVPEYCLQCCINSDKKYCETDEIVGSVIPKGTLTQFSVVPWYIKFGNLLKRDVLQNYRNPMTTKIRLCQSMFFSLIVGLLYFQIENNQKSVQNRFGALFFILINQIMNSLFNTLQTFPEFIKQLKYDKNRKKYNNAQFYLSKTLVDIPFQLLNTILYCLLSLYMTNLTHNVFEFISVIFLTVLCASSLGYFCSTISENPAMCIVFSNLLILPMMLTSGFFVNNSSVPVYLSWFKNINIFYYSYNALSTYTWKHKTIHCKPSEECLYYSGDDVLDMYNIDTDNSMNISMLVLLTCIFRLFGLGMLYKY